MDFYFKTAEQLEQVRLHLLDFWFCSKRCMFLWRYVYGEKVLVQWGMSFPAGSLTNPDQSHSKFDQSQPLPQEVWPSLPTLIQSSIKPAQFHRKFDQSCSLPQKFQPTLPTPTGDLTNPTPSLRNFDQSCPFLQKVSPVPPAPVEGLTIFVCARFSIGPETNVSSVMSKGVN